MPPSIHDFVPTGYWVNLFWDVMREALDLSAILPTYGEERDCPPHHPAMMVALLLFAYSEWTYASRRNAKTCEERLDFMAVTGMQTPNFRTISDFRKRHLATLSGLFVQVLELCRQAGLVKLGHVALDGSKIKATTTMTWQWHGPCYAILKSLCIKWRGGFTFQRPRPIVNCQAGVVT